MGKKVWQTFLLGKNLGIQFFVGATTCYWERFFSINHDLENHEKPLERRPGFRWLNTLSCRQLERRSFNHSLVGGFNPFETY